MSRRPALLLAITLACTDDGSASETPATTSTTTETTTESGAVETTESETGTPIPEDAIWIEIDGAAALAEVDERFLSFALDTDKVVHQKFDFKRPRLLELTAALSPALLRVGGTKADRVYYDMSDMPASMAPAPYVDLLDRSIWDDACEFTEALDLQMLFTINAGPGPRDVDLLWQDDQARELIQYSVAQGCPVDVWEFGNEVGSFGLEHGLALSGAAYALDFGVFAALVDELDPQAQTAGPAAIFWPVEGEVVVPIIDDFLADFSQVDILTWHFYPQQSSSCPIGSRRIDKPIPPQAWLDAVDDWASVVEGLRDASAPDAEVWLGETGHALCGGEPGISNTFASSFWWLDELGRIARRGQPIVIRQALSGGAYKLIEDSDLIPTPDYYASVLWKRHMGARVLATLAQDSPQSLHAYAHCDVAAAGGVSLLLINYAETSTPVALLDGTTSFEASIVTAASITATDIDVNGEAWSANDDGTVPVPASASGVGSLTLPGLSYAFVRMPDAGAQACL
jgi:heparanase 1